MFEWFTAWVDQNLSLTLTFALGVSPRDMLAAFGADPSHVQPQTFWEAAEDPDQRRVRVGIRGDWTYAVEQFTVLGSQQAMLEYLSRSGEALSLSYTPTIDVFLYARSGELVNGFDMTVLHMRYGSKPHRFDREMEAAGFFGPERVGAAGGARLLQRIVDIEIDREMLEGPLPSAPLPGDP